MAGVNDGHADIVPQNVFNMNLWVDVHLPIVLYGNHCLERLGLGEEEGAKPVFNFCSNGHC